jgi:hypothetical protein
VKLCKLWKLAISLAVVAALAAPLVMGTSKLRPGGWHPLPAGERDQIAKMATETDNCTHFSPTDTEIGKTICTMLLNDLGSGGRYESGDRITWRFVTKNLALMAETFVSVFIAAIDFTTAGGAILGVAKEIAHRGLGVIAGCDPIPHPRRAVARRRSAPQQLDDLRASISLWSSIRRKSWSRCRQLRRDS